MCFASKSRTLFLSRYVREVFFTAEKAKKQFGLGQQNHALGNNSAQGAFSNLKQAIHISSSQHAWEN